MGAAATIGLLNPGVVPISIGWRLALGVGAIYRFAPEYQSRLIRV